MNKVRVAAIQMATVTDKMENVHAVKGYLERL